MRSLREIADMTSIYPRTLLYRYGKGLSMDEAAALPVLTRQECGRRAAAVYRGRQCVV